MSLIVAENVTHAFGALEVLKHVSFRVGESNRIGVVGPNGEGKTTLLRIIGALLEPSDGRVHRSRGLSIGYLPQDPPALQGSTIHDAMMDVFAEVRRLEDQLHDLAAGLGGEDSELPSPPQAGAENGGDQERLLAQYGALQERFETMGGYDYRRRIEQVLTGLAFEREMWDRPLAQLSGGQRTRAYLATLLLKDPDVLMLDEPTNHLDIDSIEWLEGWLESFRGALLVVSHDRYFLDHVTRDTWEVSLGRLEAYRGSYSQYLPKRDARFEERMRQWRAQQEYIRKTEEFIRIHLAGQRTKEAQGRRTLLERFLRDEAIEQPVRHGQISLHLSSLRRTGDMVLRAEDLAVGYAPDMPLVRADRLEVRRGERIAVVGANGIGKTTLLRTLLRQLEPLSGSIRHGANVTTGYLSQTHDELAPSTSALEAVQAVGGLTDEQARSALGALLLSGDDVHRRIDELSGGQRSRIALIRLAALRAGLLMLDEPTNHLDVASAEVVQRALKDYDGAILFVSHDRYLIESLTTHIWAIDDGRIHTILGGWEAYLTWRAESSGAAVADKSAGRAKADRKAEYRTARKRANLVQRLQRRHEELEGEIDAAERRLAELNEQISAAGEAGDISKIEQLGKEYERTDTALQTLWAEWEHVGEELE